MEDITKKLIEEKLSSLPKDLNELVLNKFKEAEDLAKKVKTLEDAMQNNGITITKLQSDNATLTSQNAIIKEKEKTWEEIDKKDRNLKVTMLEHELKVEKQSKVDIYSLVSLLVKNPRAVEMFSTSISNESVWSNGVETRYPTSEWGTKETTESKD